MTRKPLLPLLKRENKKLEKKENALRRSLSSLYRAHVVTIDEIVRKAYAFARDGDALRHANLLRRIPTAELLRLRHDGAKVGAVFQFDQLNRLQALEYELLIAEYELAEREYYLIMKHLARHSEEFWMALEDYLDLRSAGMTAAVLASVLKDPQYPIEATIRNGHAKIARLTRERIEQAIVSGRSEAEASREIVAYVSRREKAHSDGVLFYEGTRTTMQVMKEVLSPVSKAFRSVTVKDGGACKLCREIETEQYVHPVPMVDFLPGVTAPPFHPYCRCGIEVIYRDDDKENA